MGPSDGHYFSDSPTAASRPGTVRVRARGLELSLGTDRGTFSPDRLDPGTELLLRSAPEPPATGRFLDLGCGWGAITAVLASVAPGATVEAVDVNPRARELTATNCARLGLTNVEVRTDSDPPHAGGYDLIWSNPPIRIGKAALHDLLATWLDRLTREGTAIIVVQRHLGADSLHRWLTERGHPTDRLGSKRGYRLLRIGAASGS